jgi:CrcB protein
MTEVKSHSREPTTYGDNLARVPQRHASRPERRRPEASTHSQHSLNEVDAPEHVQNRQDDSAWHRDAHLEDNSLESAPTPPSFRTRPSSSPPSSPQRNPRSPIATQLYIISHLIFFSLWGTLARLGVQWLTFYPGAPLVTPVLWANVGGSIVMGFLSEDRRLFREEWGLDNIDAHTREKALEQERSDPDAAKKAHGKTKKTIPLYIGLATGFCGSFTSFSSFMRDVFLALSNDLPTPVNHPYATVPSFTSTIHRNGGYSFMALLAIIIYTVALSLAALKIGAHLALALDRFTPTLPFRLTRKFLDPLIVFLAWGCWLGAIFLSIWPPDRPSGPSSRGSWANEVWRGEVLFALVFAPVGCLLRYYASLGLNPIAGSFPLGTFAVNVFGCAVEAMCYSIQHVPITSTAGALVGGGRVGCQVLQGVMDGFCGTTTTVSTWVSELQSLRRRHAYVYGMVSVVAGLCLMIIIMGSVRWTVGFSTPACVTMRTSL